MTVLGHPAERLTLIAFGNFAPIKMQRVRPGSARLVATIGATITDEDVLDALGKGFEMLGHAERLEHAPGRVSQCRSPAIKGRRKLVFHLQRINKGNP